MVSPVILANIAAHIRYSELQIRKPNFHRIFISGAHTKAFITYKLYVQGRNKT